MCARGWRAGGALGRPTRAAYAVEGGANARRARGPRVRAGVGGARGCVWRSWALCASGVCWRRMLEA